MAQSSEEPVRLTDRIEKIVEPESDEELTRSLEDIYSAAEAMLRAGEGIESIAARTKLPMSEVQMLAQLVEQEESHDVEPPRTSSPVRSGIQRICRGYCRGEKNRELICSRLSINLYN